MMSQCTIVPNIVVLDLFYNIKIIARLSYG